MEIFRMIYGMNEPIDWARERWNQTQKDTTIFATCALTCEEEPT
jgi:hypothetical protein